MRKMSLTVGLVMLVGGILLTGCGNNKPEDVAETFAKELSAAHIDKAKKMSTPDTQKEIDELVFVCNKPYRKELAKEAEQALEIIRKGSSGADISKRISSSDIEKEFENMQKSLIKKYGDVRKLPEEKRNEIMLEMMDKITSKYFKPIISDIFDKLKIEVKHPDEVKNILAKYYMLKSMGEINSYMSPIEAMMYVVKRENFEISDNVTPECVAKYTNFGFVDSINLIEVKSKSPDKAIVRLELIDKQGKSNKVSVPVEKIKNEWLVSNLPLNILPLNMW